ncbi:unnamed protein product, partial [Ixodes pacificus]
GTTGRKRDSGPRRLRSYDGVPQRPEVLERRPDIYLDVGRTPGSKCDGGSLSTERKKAPETCQAWAESHKAAGCQKGLPQIRSPVSDRSRPYSACQEGPRICERQPRISQPKRISSGRAAPLPVPEPADWFHAETPYYCNHHKDAEFFFLNKTRAYFLFNKH